ncbi:hypothetical protein Bbelb_072160 [Branchiostoma belcheri]|nr:hypothetical protein Bbelb_072160 [Branchiostoma belcheri]
MPARLLNTAGASRGYIPDGHRPTSSNLVLGVIRAFDRTLESASQWLLQFAEEEDRVGAVVSDEKDEGMEEDRVGAVVSDEKDVGMEEDRVGAVVSDEKDEGMVREERRWRAKRTELERLSLMRKMKGWSAKNGVGGRGSDLFIILTPGIKHVIACCTGF